MRTVVVIFVDIILVYGGFLLGKTMNVSNRATRLERHIKPTDPFQRELKEVTRKIAEGQDPDTVVAEMSEKMRKRFKKWKEERDAEIR